MCRRLLSRGSFENNCVDMQLCFCVSILPGSHMVMLGDCYFQEGPEVALLQQARPCADTDAAA